ncbi:TatD family hydrolase [Candidatus Mycoplasma mahonii]|uniref:TatD family hydrolase n=1 Tax=Candidatus Mycoplasma mahonii TaxID=3004105 RepID=UPI0026EAB69D|nr:TatD family hydrolase [Candidatus Mycoplasma mahonii]WKX02429.1 TatD family hydrolase [Candidatus Mycoplasma mahonii]
MKYIDTHAHIGSEFFKENETNKLVDNATMNYISYIFVPGTTKKDSLNAIEVAKKHPNVFAGVGIHPCEVDKNDTSILDEIDYNDIKFIGETGIDLYHDNNPSLENQVTSFRKHLIKAKDHNLPIEIHARDSFQQVYNIIASDEFKGITFIMHSYTGNLEWAQKFIKLGAYISFSGIVTFKNAKDVQEVVKNIPLNKILSETDSPFLTPTPYRGKMPNEPKNVKYVVDFIAAIRNEKDDEVVKNIYENAIKVFNI